MNLRDATEIVPGIWQGSMPPAGDAVARAGFKLLVLAAMPYEYEPGTPDERTYPGVRILTVPGGDDATYPPPQAERALQVAREVAIYAAAGHKVLVTCRLGRNRSGLVTALAVRMLTGLSINRVIDRIRGARLDALTNPEFVRYLRAVGPQLRRIR